MARSKFGFHSGICHAKKLELGSSEVQTLRPSIEAGVGIPSHSAMKGTMYIRTDGSSTSTRMYINTDGATTWTNLVTAA